MHPHEPRLGDIRAEHAPGYDLGFYLQRFAPAGFFGNGEAAVKRVQSSRHPVRESHEPLAAEPEFQFDRLSGPAFRDRGLRPKMGGDGSFRPEIPEFHLSSRAVRSRELPAIYPLFAGVAPEVQFVYSTCMTFEAVSIASLHGSPQEICENSEGYSTSFACQKLTE